GGVGPVPSSRFPFPPPHAAGVPFPRPGRTVSVGGASMPTRDPRDGYRLAPYPIVYSHPRIPRHIWIESADGTLLAVPNEPVGWARRRPGSVSPAFRRLAPDAARLALGYVGAPAEEVRHGWRRRGRKSRLRSRSNPQPA